jgi:ferredoxin
MKITKGKQISIPNMKNCYDIELKYMHGDADSYTYDSIGAFNENNKEEMELLKEALIACNEISYSDREDFDDMEEFKKWFNHDNYEDENGNRNDYACSMDRDATCGGWEYCSLSEFNLIYYDKNGIKYECKVEFEEEDEK